MKMPTYVCRILEHVFSASEYAWTCCDSVPCHWFIRACDFCLCCNQDLKLIVTVIPLLQCCHAKHSHCPFSFVCYVG